MVFQYIASGLIGMSSFEAGFASVVLGLLLHYLIAGMGTPVFYLASRRLTVLHRRPVLFGLLYGVFLYLFMNAVVLPLSRVPHSAAAVTLAWRINGVAALMLCIGLATSLLVRRETARA